MTTMTSMNMPALYNPKSRLESGLLAVQQISNLLHTAVSSHEPYEVVFLLKNYLIILGKQNFMNSHDEDIINLWPLESRVLSLVNMTYRNELWIQQTNTILFVFVWKRRKLFLWSMAAASVHVFLSRHTGTLLDWEYWLQAFNGMQHHSTINLLIRTTVSICCRK